MVEKINIPIHYLPNSPELKITDIGSWIDLYVYEDTFIQRDEHTYISMGVSMALPLGYEAIIAPRSSTFKRWGILQTNGIGIIDHSYRGTNDIWMMPVLATKAIMIPKGARICQFRIQKEQPQINFIPYDSLGNIDRGGFGSSGI